MKKKLKNKTKSKDTTVDIEKGRSRKSFEILSWVMLHHGHTSLTFLKSLNAASRSYMLLIALSLGLKLEGDFLNIFYLSTKEKQHANQKTILLTFCQNMLMMSI